MAESADCRVRLLRAGVGPVLVLALVSSCASAHGSRAVSTHVPTNSSVVIATTLSIPSAAGSSSTAPASGVASDGATLLQHVFDRLAGGYHFVTTATVNGAVIVTTEGDHVNDGTRLSVASKGATLDYVVTPNGTWVNQAGAWAELSDPAPVSDPIGSLRTPTSVVVSASANGTPTEVSANYAPAALAMTGDAAITVVFALDAGALGSLSYTTMANGVPAVVTSVITQLIDTSAVTLPQV